METSPQLPLDECERQLEQVYQEQQSLYVQLEAKTRQIADSPPNSHRDSQLSQVNELMSRIAALDAQVMPARERWQAANAKARPPLRATLKQLEQLIVTVMKHLDQAEDAALRAKRQLAERHGGASLMKRRAAAYGENRVSADST